MAYSKRNRLLKIIDVQEVYKANKTDGNTAIYVFNNYIKNRFRISLATLYVYLETRARHLLKELDDEPENKNVLKQLTMGFDDPATENDA